MSKSKNFYIVDNNFLKRKTIHENYFNQDGNYKKIRTLGIELNHIVNFGYLYQNDTKQTGQKTNTLNLIFGMYNKRIDELNSELILRKIPEKLLMDKMELL